MAIPLQLDDIQGVVARGYRNLRAARFVLLRIADPPAARAWLGALAGEVATSVANPTDHAVNLGLTSSGLMGLGLPTATV